MSTMSLNILEGSASHSQVNTFPPICVSMLKVFFFPFLIELQGEIWSNFDIKSKQIFKVDFLKCTSYEVSQLCYFLLLSL